MLVSEDEGVDIQKEHRFLRGLLEKKTEKYNAQKIIENNDLVFLHKPHSEYHEKTAELIDLSAKKKKDVRFIDLSADFRLKDKNLYNKWYGFTHKRPELLPKAVYGLTELYRKEIKDATLVANPGCYPTATLLALAPLLEYGMVDSDQTIIIDALSGVSGAGKAKNGNGGNGINLAVDVEQNVVPYKIGRKHQHISEIEQEINNILKKKIEVIFSPHVLSFLYGISSTNYVTLQEPYEWEEINSVYKKMYGNESFIRIADEDEYPQVKDVEGTNFCDIGFDIDKNTKKCSVISVIDNVIKGASGQAMQNMNIMYGFDETEGFLYGRILREKRKNVNP